VDFTTGRTPKLIPPTVEKMGVRHKIGCPFFMQNIRLKTIIWRKGYDLMLHHQPKTIIARSITPTMRVVFIE
jgi:hypothetical protein